ncbi:hypothetical protein Tco_0397072 [Tanacetum coccineum]
MGSITSLKCVLTQEHLDVICAKYFVLEEVQSLNTTKPDATNSMKRTNWMDLNAFIHTADPRKVRIVERPRAENERPIITVAKHRTVTLLPTSVGFDSVAGRDNVEPSVHVTEPVEAEVPKPKHSKKKRVIYDSEGLPVSSHPPKRLRTDYGTTSGSVTGGPSTRFVVLSNSSHHSSAKSADPEVDSLVRSAAPVMTELIQSSEKTDRTLRGTFLQGDRSSGLMRVSAASLAEEARKWRSLAEEKNILLEAKDKWIEDLKSKLLRAKEESTEVTQLRAQVSGLEATENSLRGEVASVKDHNVLLEQECNSLKLKDGPLIYQLLKKNMSFLELRERRSSSLKSQNQSLVDQLEEFQDNLMGPLRTRFWREIDTEFKPVVAVAFQESFHPHTPQRVVLKCYLRWLLTHVGMKPLVVKVSLIQMSTEALGLLAFGRQ